MSTTTWFSLNISSFLLFPSIESHIRSPSTNITGQISDNEAKNDRSSNSSNNEKNGNKNDETSTHTDGGQDNETTTVTPRPTVNSVPIDLGKCMYVVFDLETTGFSKERNHIIEIAAQIVNCNGVRVNEGTYYSLVSPPVPIPSIITQLTNITNEDVAQSSSFKDVGVDFIRWIIQKKNDWEEDNGDIEHIVFVAQNGRRFNLPFLFYHLKSD